MRTIERTGQFKRDYKREKRGRHGPVLDALLRGVIGSLAANAALQPKHVDHPLSGEWRDCRDCHLRPDLVLIYQKPDDDRLRLIRLGSHAELSF